MRGCYVVCIMAVVLGFALCMVPSYAVPGKGELVPDFKTVDINGQEVSLDTIVKSDPKPDLVILFFFTASTGEEIAVKLRRLDLLYSKNNQLKIVAIGWKEDEAALKTFAGNLGIKYHVLKNTPELEKYGPFATLPVTFIVTDEKKVYSSLSGSGEAEADLINNIAQGFFQQRKTEAAKALADEAVKAGENPKDAGNIKGFALTAEGKLDEAQAEFGKIGSKEGLAKVALEKGENDKAIAIANEAGAENGYAGTVKAEALMHSGKLDEAATALDAAKGKPAADWQQSEARNAAGRVQQEKGNSDAAITKYQEAVALDPYNVVALSNEGAAHRQKGDLKKAAEVLEKAQTVRNDDLVTVMLQQVQNDMKQANDIKRGELIRSQIADLRARYEALKAAGKDKPVDDWTSPAIVLAFLPSEKPQTAFFDRAGTDIVLRRELEARLQASGDVRIVEREVLDKLLQELNLGSSEIAKQDTQLQLGKVLSARMLGFVDFASVGPDTVMYLRLVDTETTSIAAQFTETVNKYPKIESLVDALVANVLKKVVNGRQLQGLIADAAADDNIIINLGKQHGVKAGQTFAVIKEGDPIQAGGKVLGHREVKVAMIEVTQVEDQYAICKVVSKEQGAQLAKEMKIRQPKTN